jgi:hypothetical protein
MDGAFDTEYEPPGQVGGHPRHWKFGRLVLMVYVSTSQDSFASELTNVFRRPLL